MKIVLADGCFDLLHPGHVAHLEEARQMGDYLVVGLTRDRAVNKGPGRPVQPWADRATMLRALRCVDAVMDCDSDVEAILSIRPTFFVKGPDYVGKINAATRGACKMVQASIHFTTAPKRSTTELLHELRCG